MTGPVQMLVVSFDEPGFNGEIIDEMRRLNDGGVIRLIDALAVQKNLDGTLTALQWSDLSIPDAEEYGATLGALLGLGMAGEEGMHAGAVVGAEAGSDGHVMDESESEVWDLAHALKPGSAAAVALIEHMWAEPLRGAIERAGGVPVSDAWVHPRDLVEIGILAADE
jgi:uncharacterized membrane protein